MSLVILVPVLARPQNVAPLLDSIRTATPHARVLFICDPDDFDEQRAVHDNGGETLLIDGNYAAKINAGVRVTTEARIFLGADDLHFHAGWYEAAAARLKPPIGIVGTQDQCNPRVIAGEHATHFLMARWYALLGTIDGRPGPLCEDYPHEFVDDELVATARSRRAWAFADDSIVEHLHPDAGKAPMDGIYAGRRRRMRVGRQIFQERSALWT